jgi:hypothetical protein
MRLLHPPPLCCQRRMIVPNGAACQQLFQSL